MLAGLATVWGPAGPAQACSCAITTTADHLRAADVVFVGTLVERTVEEPITSSTDPARHLFVVDRALKGEVPQRAVVMSAVSGASCGMELQGSGPFVVFAADTGNHFEAGLCTGTTELTPGLEAEVTSLSPQPTARPAPTVVPSSQASPEGSGWRPTPAIWAGAGALLATVPLSLLLRRRRRG